MRAAIILALVAIVSLGVSATKVNQIIPVKRSNRLDLEHLIDALSVTIKGTQGSGSKRHGNLVETKEAPKVLQLLAQTEPKNEIHLLLKFTIDDLLKLNDWTIDDCNGAKITKRREKCLQFFEEGRFEEGTSDLIYTERKDYVHYNIGKYCWKLVHDLESKCPVARKNHALNNVESLLGFTGTWILNSFEKDLKRHILEKHVPAHRPEFFNKAVLQVFGDKSKRNRLVQICKGLVAELKEFYDAKKLAYRWAERVRECSVINNIPDDN